MNILLYIYLFTNVNLNQQNNIHESTWLCKTIINYIMITVILHEQHFVCTMYIRMKVIIKYCMIIK